MKNFEITLKIPIKAVCKENVENWLDDFVIPDLITRWSDGNIRIKSNIEEVK